MHYLAWAPPCPAVAAPHHCRGGETTPRQQRREGDGAALQAMLKERSARRERRRRRTGRHYSSPELGHRQIRPAYELRTTADACSIRWRRERALNHLTTKKLSSTTSLPCSAPASYHRPRASLMTHAPRYAAPPPLPSGRPASTRRRHLQQPLQLPRGARRHR
jgi:hypothetical protein